ncbi:MAG: hypothetical protein ACYDCN_06325 [Bacteroidia bacterium]
MAKRKKSINFPIKDELFNVALIALMYHLGIIDPDAIVPTGGTPLISWIRLNITPAKYNALLALFGTATTPNTWLLVYPLEKNHSTRTGTLTTQKKALKKKILAIIHPERTILKATEKSTPGTLTPSDATLFFIPEANPRTNSAEMFRIADAAPLLKMHLVKHLEHVVDANDPESPKSTALPAGVVFIWLLIYVGTVAPTDWSQFKHLKFCTKFRNISNFLAAQAKQDVWYTACFIGESGAMSNFSPFLHSTIAQTA